MTRELFPYQSRAKAEILSLFRAGKRRVLGVSPMGSGKTVLALNIARHAKRPVLWLTHRVELAEQVREDRDTPANVEVRTIQGLLASGERPEAGLIIWDECHHSISDCWRQVLDAYPDSYLLGLTATPCRADGRALGDIFDEIVVGAQYSELLACGRIVECDIFSADVERGLATNPVEAYLRFARGQRTFAFFSTMAESQRWADAFVEAGIPAAPFVSETHADVRKQRLVDFKAGKLLVLTTVDVLTEGVNVPEASCVILGRRFEHEGAYMQASGRVLRATEGKVKATVLDITACYGRHGPPTVDRVYSLEGRPIRQGCKLQLKNCPECGAVLLSSAPGCKHCGHEFESVPRPVTIHDLELQQVYDGAATPKWAKRGEWDRLLRCGHGVKWARDEFVKLFGDEPPAAWLRERQTRADERARLDRLSLRINGNRRGWIAHRWREAFGVWPRGLDAA